MMKKITLITFLTLFVVAFSGAQELLFEDFDTNYVDGQNGTEASFDAWEGGIQITYAAYTGNTTLIIKATEGGNDNMYIFSKYVNVQEGDLLSVNFDFATSAGQFEVDMWAAGQIQPLVPVTTDNGAWKGGTNRNGVINGHTTLLYGNITATFQIPAGVTSAALRVYQWGNGSIMEMDNVFIEKTGTASLDDLVKFDFKSYPNPVKDVLRVSANSRMEKIEIYSLLGQNVLSKSINNTKDELNVSSLSRGVYLAKVYINDSVGTYKIIKE